VVAERLEVDHQAEVVVDYHAEKLEADHQAGMVVVSLWELNIQLQLGYCCQSRYLYIHLV